MASKKTKTTAKPAGKKPRVRRSIRRGGGVLALIGGLLLASATLRIAVGASDAMAANEAATTEGEHSTPEMASSSGAGAEPGAAANQVYVSEEDLRPMIEALKAREARVATLEEEIDVRMQALSVAENEIDRKLARLEEAEASLRATLATARTAAEDDVARLTDVYASMKPKQAAALFETMDPEFAAGFLGRMQPDAAAAILAGLTPETAYTISVIVAGRNANAPRQ